MDIAVTFLFSVDFLPQMRYDNETAYNRSIQIIFHNTTLFLRDTSPILKVAVITSVSCGHINFIGSIKKISLYASVVKWI